MSQLGCDRWLKHLAVIYMFPFCANGVVVIAVCVLTRSRGRRQGLCGSAKRLFRELWAMNRAVLRHASPDNFPACEAPPPFGCWRAAPNLR